MGYYIDGSGELTVKTINIMAAFKAVCRLNADHSLKRGGRYPAGGPKPADSSSRGNPNAWFAWMPWNYDETCQTLAEVFTELGFNVDTNDDGDVVIGSYSDKVGDESHFLDAIAPYIEPATYDWVGEDGTHWRDVYANGRRAQLTGTITYQETAAQGR